ncbi:MAG: tRNA (adenosine(37)-N6)-threonylcarbamoyltransferase complex ATPase subunit type 1 TsaE [Gammaproteobacteria bacterium]|nr:MAG: tRNA (adenosine(37)-N6)-threonylcarbamoyltransferase complex ATPase subunit type 1 TsaE [Gammaproteobacteria bacterium]
MVALGRQMAQVLADVRLIGFSGDLGAGKTTLVRGLLQALGHEGAVTSPTFTLVQPYTLGSRSIFHFDLYRLQDPQELEDIGWREYFQPGQLCLLEWPEKAQGLLPVADIDVMIQKLNTGRRVVLNSQTPAGDAVIAALS